MSSSVDTTDRFTGRVKWFNNKAGYGFITVTDGPKSGSDIFVHHSSINVDHEQYKYLVQGEYIEFTLNATNSESEHEIQAGNVSGIKGGKLMCETRNETRVVRSQYRSSRPEQTRPEQGRPEQGRPERGRARDQDQDGFQPVKVPRSRPVPTSTQRPATASRQRGPPRSYGEGEQPRRVPYMGRGQPNSRYLGGPN
jgi:CspA family cold shock protein